MREGLEQREESGVRRAPLHVGIALLVVAAFFITWALLRPLGRELQEAERQ